MYNNLKEGDRVKLKPEFCAGIKSWEVGRIIERDCRYLDSWFVSFEASPGTISVVANQLMLVDETNKQQDKKMNIKDQFLLAITSEPQKSFRKAGVTNGDDLLTEDGQKVFLAWLLKQNQDAFKKEIVDPILEEMKNEKK